VSSDGRLLLYFTGNALSRTGNDLFVIELDDEKKATTGSRQRDRGRGSRSADHFAGELG
jgi:hypothetical protein